MEIVYGACYHLLSDYERRMDPVDLETAAYGNSCEAFAVGLHAVRHRPRLKTDNRPPPKCDFPECLVAVEVPPQLSQHYMAVMALWLRWDPFTDRMATFDVPPPDTRDLWQYSADAWDERRQIRRALDERRTRADQQLWAARMEEKLRAFEAVDRSQYPDDLKAYVDELEARATREGEEESEEPMPSEKIAEGRAESFEKTPSEEMEKRRLGRMEAVSDSLKYPEKLNELNPRRYFYHRFP